MVGYGIGDAIAIIAGAMVAMQITDWRAERPIVWLLVAMVVTLVADLLWVNAELRGTYVIGGAQRYRLFRVLPLHVRRRALSARATPDGRSRHSGLQGDLRGSLPIVALMVGTIALLDDRLKLASGQSPLLIVGAGRGHAAGGGRARHSPRAKWSGLHREVATRRFDERLTELVRRSSDMIAICDADGVIRYASPSSEQLLGVAPGELAGQRSTMCSGRRRRRCARSSTR